MTNFILYNLLGAKELERARLNPFHQLSDNIYLQQYDQFGKCHSVKVLHVSYKERPSLRTDRVTEALPSFIKGIRDFAVDLYCACHIY